MLHVGVRGNILVGRQTGRTLEMPPNVLPQFSYFGLHVAGRTLDRPKRR